MQPLDDISDDYDREFYILMIEIEKKKQKFTKHYQLKIESWCRKLSQVTNNIEWKKGRNLHAICLFDNLLNNRFDEPYNKFAPEGPIPILSKTLVKSRLSNKLWKHMEKVNNRIFKFIEEENKNDFNKADNSHQRILSNNSKDVQGEVKKHSDINTPKKKPRSYVGKDTMNENYNDNKNKNINNNNNNLNAEYNGSEMDKKKILISRLQSDLDKMDIIIQKQREEKKILLQRLEQLKKMITFSN